MKLCIHQNPPTECPVCLKQRVEYLEAVLTKALPVVRLTAYPTLTQRIEDALNNKLGGEHD